MYTQEIKRNKGNTFREMNFLGSSSSNSLTKLGGSLVSSMQSLRNKKQQILQMKNANNMSRLVTLVDEFKKQHQNFLNLQKNLFQLDQSTPQTQKLKVKVKQFLQTIKIDEVENKLQNFQQDIIRDSQRIQIMNKVQKPTAGTQLIMDNRQLIRQKLLEQQAQQVKAIAKMIADIKNISIKTADLIYEQGVNLNLAAQTIKTAKEKFKEGKQELLQANKYQQDANRGKCLFCSLIVVVVLVILLILIASRKKSQ